MGRAPAAHHRAAPGVHAGARRGAGARRAAFREVAASGRCGRRRQHPAHGHRQDRQEAAARAVLRPPDEGERRLNTRPTALLAGAALLAFAGNSLLCRLALGGGHIDAASFATVRVSSGALLLALLSWPARRPGSRLEFEWRTVAALAAYMVCFSRSEEHTSELQSLRHLVCRLLLEK